MNRKHRKTLEQIFRKPPSGTIRWSDIEALFRALGADVSEREGSRVAVILFGSPRLSQATSFSEHG
jgi:hypothetical protein